MFRRRRWPGRLVAGLSAATALALAVGPAASASTARGLSAATQANNFTVVNSASSETGPQARGGFVTLYTAAPVTDEEGSYPFPWPQQTPGGLYLQTDSCQDENDYRKLPILYVGRSGDGSQVNAYVPNVDDGDETNGPCDASGNDRFILHPKPGFGGDITVAVRTAPSRPGIFTAGPGAHPAPAGYHLNAKNGRQTPFTDCSADPTACPVSTGGVPNFLVVFTTGAEIYGCPNEEFACDDDDGVSFYLAPVAGDQVGVAAEQPVRSFGYAGFVGQEQANVQLRADTPPGDYRLSARTPEPDNSAQQLTVRLGPATNA